MDFKQLKKSMMLSFQAIRTQSKDGELPNESECNKFARLCTQLHMQAEDDWMDEADDFAHLATQLYNAVKKNQLEDAVRLVESLHEAQIYCHRTYKS